MSSLTMTQKAEWVLDKARKKSGAAFQISKISKMTGISRPMIYKYMADPVLLTERSAEQLSYYYDELHKSIAGQMLQVQIARQRFKDTQAQMVNMIKEAKEETQLDSYTEQVTDVLIMLLQKKDSELLHVLMEYLGDDE